MYYLIWVQIYLECRGELTQNTFPNFCLRTILDTTVTQHLLFYKLPENQHYSVVLFFDNHQGNETWLPPIPPSLREPGRMAPPHFHPVIFPAETTSPIMDVYGIEYPTPKLYPWHCNHKTVLHFHSEQRKSYSSAEECPLTMSVFKMHLKVNRDCKMIKCLSPVLIPVVGGQGVWCRPAGPFSVQDFYTSRQVQGMEICLSHSCLTPGMADAP